MNEKNQDVFS